MTLVEFLLARIAGDERAAAGGIEGALLGRVAETWRLDDHPAPYDSVPPAFEVVSDDDTASSVAVGFQPAWRGRHIARWDPDRVLAECEAKRRIVAMHMPGKPWCGIGSDAYGDHGGGPVGLGDCDTLRLLVLPYADHPDYDSAWAPERVGR